MFGGTLNYRVGIGVYLSGLFSSSADSPMCRRPGGGIAMSYLVAAPAFLASAATDLSNIGSTLSAANAAAAATTTEVVAAGADEVSAGIAALFGVQGQAYQALSAQAAAFHEQFVQTLTAGGSSYAAAEAAAASPLQSVVDPINAQVQAATGGGAVPIYQAIQQANEKLLITFTNGVGRLEQPLAPYFEGFWGRPVPPPIPFPSPINGAV